MSCVGNHQYGTLPDVELTVIAVEWTSTPEEERGAWARVYVAIDGEYDARIVLVATRWDGTRRHIADLVVGGENAPQIATRLPWGRIEFFLQGLPGLPSEQRADDPESGVLPAPGNPLAEAIFDEWIRLKGQTHAAMAFSDTPTPGEHRDPLQRPTGVNTDEFYRRVAEAYTEVIRQTRAVAPRLAEESGVPVRTVHGWIREARRRGYLPPSNRGER